nr:hypothetical protein [Kibdelosporangium sp. MJ126-NF4]
MIDPTGRERHTQRLGDVLLTDHLSEGRRTVLAVKGERHEKDPTQAHRQSRRQDQPDTDKLVEPQRTQRWVERSSHRGGLGARPPEMGLSDPAKVAKQPSRGRERKADPVHLSEPAYPCCLPALGRFTRWTPHEVQRQCSNPSGNVMNRSAVARPVAVRLLMDQFPRRGHSRDWRHPWRLPCPAWCAPASSR